MDCNMKIQVKQINNTGEVVVKTSIGSLAGMWRYKYGPPIIDFVSYAEIDINTTWEELTKTHLQNVSSYKVNVTNEKVVFRGMIEDVEEDMVWFRLTEACLIMINTDSPAPSLKNEWYELVVDISSVEIWAYR